MGYPYASRACFASSSMLSPGLVSKVPIVPHLRDDLAAVRCPCALEMGWRVHSNPSLSLIPSSSVAVALFERLAERKPGVQAQGALVAGAPREVEKVNVAEGKGWK